jgi:choice-of-anchor A domain-containing protein
MFVNNLKFTLLMSLAVFSYETKAQSPTSAALNFNVFTKGDATLSSHESEGPIAIGGNLTTNQYQISFESRLGVYRVNGSSIGLAVRGGVKLGSGALQVNGTNYVKIGDCTPAEAGLTPLKVWYKDNNGATSTIHITGSDKAYSSEPMIKINANVGQFNQDINNITNPVCENVFTQGANPIDIDGAFTKFSSRSAQLAGLEDNLAIRDQNGKINPSAPVGPYLKAADVLNNPKIIVDPNKINVLTVSADVWNIIQNSNVEGFPGGHQPGTTSYNDNFGLIVNIVNYDAFASSGDMLRFPQFGGISSDKGSMVIYNFPDATGTVKLAGNTEINGTIFTPNADLVKNGSNNINGQVIAKSFLHNGGEIHFYPFLPSVTEPATPKLTVTATPTCIKDAPYVTYNVSANFNTSGESALIEWVNKDGKVIHQNNSQPLNGTILFPGTIVDQNGIATAYPGWNQASPGKWEPITDIFSSLLEPGATIRVTVGTSESVAITYPKSTSTCRTTPTVALPVKIAGFNAAKVNCDVQLKWKVTEASNFSHFVVQRSSDARTFAAVGQLDYNPDDNNYVFTESPFSIENSPSKTFYYRLEQIDTDGSKEYSSIRSVEAGQCDSRLSVDFYPNPVVDEINVKSYSAVAKLEIVNLAGKQIYSVAPAKGQNEIRVDVAGFQQGIYIINVTNAEGQHSSKMLKR